MTIHTVVRLRNSASGGLLLADCLLVSSWLNSNIASSQDVQAVHWNRVMPQVERPAFEGVLSIPFRISRRASGLALRLRSLIRCSGVVTSTALAMIMVSSPAVAQQQIASVTRTSSDSLPDAPEPQQGIQSSTEQDAREGGTASITGTVLDSTGASVPGATVTLTHRDGKTVETVKSAENGQFIFSKLPAGSYLVIVSAPGFAAFTSSEFALSPQQEYEIPNIALTIGSTVTEVTVRPTEVIAAEQIKAEEKQRLLGIIPNFYVSYVYDAAPMTTKQKYSLAAHDTLDWTTFIGVGIGAGIGQANNDYKGYGQGAAGYAKRYGAKLADGRISDFLTHAVYASWFHQDPRYFYQGTGTKKSRLMHAISSAFITRRDGGGTMPNYSYYLGVLTSSALSNAYYPSTDRGGGLVLSNVLWGIEGNIAQNIRQEFLGRRFTKHAAKDPAAATPTAPAGTSPSNNTPATPHQ